MKNILKILFLSSILSANALAIDAGKETASPLAKAPVTKPAPMTDDTVVAEYDGKKVILKDVLGQYKELFENQPAMKGRKFEELDRSIQDNIIKGYVHSKLVEEEVSKTNIKETPEYKKKLEEVKNQLAQQLFIENMLKEKVKDSDVKSEYDKIKKENADKQEAKASHILVDSEQTAKEVKAKLDKGAKFADLAKEYSKDEGSKTSGGELGYFGKGQLVPEFETKAFSMKKGEVSNPVKTQFGWHIIKLDDVRQMKMPSFEEVKQSIQAKMSRDAFEKYIEEISKKHNLKVNF